jgi:hypothetical protein
MPQSPILDFARHQRVAQRNGGLLAALLVAGANLLPFFVIHQRQIDWEGTLGKFDGRARPSWAIVQEDVPEVAEVLGHQQNSTANGAGLPARQWVQLQAQFAGTARTRRLAEPPPPASHRWFAGRTAVLCIDSGQARAVAVELRRVPPGTQPCSR